MKLKVHVKSEQQCKGIFHVSSQCPGRHKEHGWPGLPVTVSDFVKLLLISGASCTMPFVCNLIEHNACAVSRVNLI